MTVEMIDILMRLVTLASLVFAVWTTRDLIRIKRDLKGQGSVLSDVESSMSTRYIDKFPAFNKDIRVLLEGANSSIEIVCDLPAYGLISANDEWLKIKALLEARSLRDDFSVSLTCYGKDKRIEIIDEQADFIDRTKDDFFDRYGDIVFKVLRIARESFSRTLYLERSEEEHVRVLNNALQHCSIKETNQRLPLYVWIRDDSEAIFAIPAYSDEVTEHGFYTRDASIIRALKVFVVRIKEEATTRT